MNLPPPEGFRLGFGAWVIMRNSDRQWYCWCNHVSLNKTAELRAAKMLGLPAQRGLPAAGVPLAELSALIQQWAHVRGLKETESFQALAIWLDWMLEQDW